MAFLAQMEVVYSIATQQEKVRHARGWKAPGFAACCPELRGCLAPTVLSCLRRDGEEQHQCPGESSFQTNNQHWEFPLGTPEK